MKNGQLDLAKEYGMKFEAYSGLCLRWHLANERRRNFVTTSLIGWV